VRLDVVPTVDAVVAGRLGRTTVLAVDVPSVDKIVAGRG